MVSKKEKEENFVKEDALTECEVKLTGTNRETYNLYEAIENNDLNAAIKAIENGANLNAFNKPCSTERDTPLEAAALWANTYNCSYDMIKLLKENGANLFDPEKVEFIEDADKCLLKKVLWKKKYRN